MSLDNIYLLVRLQHFLLFCPIALIVSINVRRNEIKPFSVKRVAIAIVLAAIACYVIPVGKIYRIHQAPAVLEPLN